MAPCDSDDNTVAIFRVIRVRAQEKPPADKKIPD
jgi:hypothetical protein